MYCPNCEFEIKQEVTNCPICGGELTEYPAEKTDAHTGSDNSKGENDAKEKPIDTCISDLILDAKHELDSLDSTSDSDTQPIEPFSGSLDFESMLSEDPPEPSQPTNEPFTIEPPVPFDIPDEHRPHEDMFLQDETSIPFQKTDAPVVPESPFGQNGPPENLFSDDNLFIDETTSPTGTPDTNPLIDETSEKPPESSLESTILPPREKSYEQPWSLQELSAPEPTETMNFIPEEQTEQPDDAPTQGLDFMDIEEARSTETAENQKKGKGPRSTKRLVFILLFGVLLIAGAYAFNEFFPQFIEKDQAKKPIQPRMIRRTAVKRTHAPAQPVPLEHAAEPAEKPSSNAASVDKQKAAPDQTTTEGPTAETLKKTPAYATSKNKQQATTEQPAPVEPAAKPSENKPENPAAAAATKAGEDTGTAKKQDSAARPYTIHVASFKAQKIALKEVEQLVGLGFDAYIETVDLGEKGIWHRVKVGHYTTRADAEQTVEIIRQKKPEDSPLIYKNK